MAIATPSCRVRMYLNSGWSTSTSMRGSSVVPGLPIMYSTPAACRISKKACRPAMRSIYRSPLLRFKVKPFFAVVEISLGVHALVLSRHAASGIGLCGLSHFDARQDQKTELILDRQGMMNTDIHHGI